MAKKTTASIFKSWSNIKKEVKGLAKSKKPIQDAQKILKKFVTQAEKDLKHAVEKDIPKLVKKFKKEKNDLEKTVEKVVKTEIKKAQKSLQDFKKEVKSYDVRINLVPPSIKATKKKTKKKTAKKKTTKKKVTKKKSTKKKTTSRKKATKKKS